MRFMDLIHESWNMFMDLIHGFWNWLLGNNDHQGLQTSSSRPDPIAIAKKVLNLDTRHFFNFGVAGMTKTGKSSLINAFRGLLDTDPGAAEVDIIETTQEVTKYDYPHGLKARLYDIPGSGVLNHPSETYYVDKGLCGFDCLIIMVQPSIGQEEIKLAQTCKEFHQPVCFVRSQCDIDILKLLQTNKIREINQEEVDKLIGRMSKFFREQIDKVPELTDIPLFFISARTMYQIANLQQPDVVYQEKELMEFISQMIQETRGTSFSPIENYN